MSPKIQKAFTTATNAALFFAPIFLIFLIATIFMVGGDGSAPSVTHLSAAILSFTVKFLGISSGGSVFYVVMFWSLIVYINAFLYVILIQDVAITDNFRAEKSSIAISVLIFISAIIILILARQNNNIQVNEKQLAIEFVKNNAKISLEAGGKTEVSLVSTTMLGRVPTMYEISVHGEKTIFAIVEVSRTAKPATFILSCTTEISSGYREAYKHPCEQ
jgi:hypothetical protein